MSEEFLQKAVQSYNVPTDERTRIIDEAQIEREWLRGIATMYTQAELLQSIEAGVAQRMPNSGTGYELSVGIPDELRVLRPEAKVVLEMVAGEWQHRCVAQGLDIKNVYLRITSLARTVEYERYLATQGYPIVGEGSHTKLMAFDIYVSWLEVNAPEHWNILTQILHDLHKTERVNIINEPSVGVCHVAVNPHHAKM